jgi:uncharacterized protein
MSNGSVIVVETAPIKECKYCLVGAPDVGLVGSIALGYVILEQQMAEVGHLESDAFPPIIVVHQGDPKHPLRLYSKGNIVAVISEMPIDARLIPLVARSIVDWAESKNAEILIALSGIAVQNRLEIDIPAIYGIGSSALMKKLMKDQEIEIFEEGFITGLHAVVMKECLKKGVSNMILLAQSHLQYPDPGAAASLIASFDKMVGLKVDTKKLLARADETRVRLRELMQRTQQQMQQTQKGHEQEIPPMYV